MRPAGRFGSANSSSNMGLTGWFRVVWSGPEAMTAVVAIVRRRFLEYWIPAEGLEEFNRHIVGSIEVIAEHR